MIEVQEMTSIEQQIAALQAKLEEAQAAQRQAKQARRDELQAQIDQWQQELHEVERELGIDPVPWRVNRLLGERRRPRSQPHPNTLNGPKQNQVADVVKKFGPLTAQEIADKLPWKTDGTLVSHHLRPFVALGKIRKNGSYRGTYEWIGG